MKISIVAPVYNESESLDLFYHKTMDILTNIHYELIFINDGSTDDSLKVLKKIAKSDKDVKVISFSRNFGKEAAIYAGLSNASGEYTVIIDTDLQQNPKYILDMYNFLENNREYDSVCLYQEHRRENKLQIFCKKLGYKLLDRMTKVKFVNGASDFRMFNKKMREAIISLCEKNRFSKGIFSWVGFNTKYLPYEVENRQNGKSSWSPKKLFSYGISGIISFTTKPLRASTYVGLLTSIIAFIYLIVIVCQTLIVGKSVPGYASTMCVVLLLGGIQLICMGIIGEYISKLYYEVKNRPIYIEKEKINFENEK